MLRFFATLLLFLGIATQAMAAEEILSFDSKVDVQKNGDLVVTETITVWAEGNQIRRGIFRDFPVGLIVNGIAGTNSFELISAKRDGRAENYRIEKTGKSVRVYFGSADVFLKPGRHTYELVYTTDRQVRFFDDHDEVFWNATGTEWAFPILKATATILLPPGGRVGDTVSFTGPYGSKANDARSSIAADGRSARFEILSQLGRREGMTVGVKFAKGIVAAPTQQQRLEWFLRDRKADLAAVAGVILAFMYYLYAWMRVGRDPPEDVVVPRWDLPDGVSPALTHYIWNRGLKRQGFPAISAAAINLAVNGHLKLEKLDGTMTLHRTSKASPASFPIGERTVIERVDAYGGQLPLTADMGTKIETLATQFRSAMESEHRNDFYRNNYGWIVPGVLISIATILGAVFLGGLGAESLGAIIPVSFFGVVATFMAVQIAKRLSEGPLGAKLQLAFYLFFVGVVAVNGGLSLFSGFVGYIQNPLLIGAIVTLVMLNLLFFWLMGAPTPIGQKRTAEVAGLRQYLNLAEADRMNMLGAPDMSPTHYETLLPYAVGLGVEKPWTNAFQNWLAAAVAAGAVAATSYHGPGWYAGDGWGSGGTFSADDFGDTFGNLSGDLADSFTEALPRQDVSSSGFGGGGGGGGGGGFSGGGGGGGGGGGW